MSAISIDSVILRSDDIVCGVVDSDMMMMSIENGKYYQLNPSAGRIWNTLEQPMTVSGLCDKLCKEFKVTPEDCRKDVLPFLDELVSRKILIVQEPQ
jgi:hypothetical protein